MDTREEKRFRRIAFWRRLFGLAPKIYSNSLAKHHELSRSKAMEFGHSECSELHMLLTLTEANEGIGPSLLRTLGFRREEVTKRIMDLLPPLGQATIKETVQFSAEYKIMLALASRDALSRRDYFIGTHHVLFAFIRRQKTPCQLLASFRINAESLEAELTSMERRGMAKD